MTRPHRTALTAAASIALIAVVGLGIAPAQAMTEVDSISVGANPLFVAFTPDGTKAYVTNFNADSVSVIATATNTVAGSVPVGDGPKGVAVTPSGARVYVTNRNAGTVSVIDVATAAVVKTITVGTAPESVAITPDGTKAYVANGGHTLSVIRTSDNVVTATLSLPGSPEGVTVSPDGTFVWVAISSDDTVLPIQVSTNTLYSALVTGDHPTSIAFNADGSRGYVTNYGTAPGTVTIIDTVDLLPIGTISVGNNPTGIATNFDHSLAFVTSYTSSSNAVTVLDLMTEGAIATLNVGANPQGVAVNPVRDQVYVANYSGWNVSVLSYNTDRIAGADRYQTAVNISQAAYPGGATVVYVATGSNFPDALAAGPVAANDSTGGPILLTPSGGLPPAVSAEITRLHPSRIVVLGGTVAVPPAVFTQLQALAPTVSRISGSDRYDTARKVVRAGYTTAQTVLLATGANFPDALSGGAVGAVADQPIVLVNGSASSVDAATLDLLADLGTTDIFILGGPSAVSSAIEAQLNGSFSVARIAGSDRFDTSVAINGAAYGASDHAILATGANFPDALAGAAYAKYYAQPLYAVRSSCVPNSVLKSMMALGVKNVTLLGGTATLTVAVENLVHC